MVNKIYVDVHVLQTVAPSNLNRDDQGQPKSCVFGGVQRSRVSSQAWKKQVREYFKDHLEPEKVGVRTKQYGDLLIQKIMEKDSSLDEKSAAKKAAKILDMAGFKLDKDGKGVVLTFISPEQIDHLARIAVERDVEKVKKSDKAFMSDLMSALGDGITADMALFGRMVASEPSLNVDASCQVAHAISTHEVTPDYDYFTAVDDLKSDDQQGSAHLGDSPFTSATLYRYATIDATALVNQIGKDAALEAIRLFLEGFIKTIPTGKQNSFSAHNLPFFVEVSIRDDMPISYAGAFEKPVFSTNGFERPSLKAYEEFKKHTQKVYGEEVVSITTNLFDENPKSIHSLVQETVDIVERDLKA